ncbi:MAG: 4'-phosphopantetheinyl transferase Sfp [Luteibacter sp.]|uniref:4'-phosphopantetheinyl transferase family protein n=1 Tax=Luteibacter sp. TaxID=1886636 RepID=UPI00137C482D|nr:4'-phosphopantetheinyl transferase superfamily protein [Luteibacter sp.]KAF1007411.1 MAG: 4'-phosphopantetheinyl transferase Sfp [Luteibacter sp.]
MAAAPTLRRHDVHVYLVKIDESLERKLLSSYEGLLDDGERDRFDRLTGEHTRTEFLVTRALCRIMLSEFADRPPDAWRFDTNAHGKPCIANGGTENHLEFNLSNSKGLVACVVGTGCRLGIDVEPHAQIRNVEAMARRFFTASEAGFVVSAEPSERLARFIGIWTLKEAFVKAWGSGMSLPLDMFSFDTQGHRPAHFFHTPSLGNPKRWRFHAWDVAPAHRMALAIATEESDARIGVTLRYGVPRLSGGNGWFDSPGAAVRLLLPA